MARGRDMTRGAARRAAALVLALALCLGAWAEPVPARTVSYTYDAAGRLTGADYTGGDFTAEVAYEYDPAGNRVAETITSTLTPVSPTGLAQAIASTLLGRISPDSDGDGMLDAWERDCFGDLSRDGTGDYDSDGLTDLRESQLDTDPTKQDTDGDGWSDGSEVEAGTDPKDADDHPTPEPVSVKGLPWLRLLLSYAAPEPPPPDPYGPNLMQGVTIWSTNSTAASGHGLDLAVDGDEATFWASNTTADYWTLRWDMGDQVSEAPDRFGLLVGGEGWWGVTSFTLQAVGDDGWTTLLTVEHSAGLGQWQYWDLPGGAVYQLYRMIIYSTYQAGGQLPSIMEMSLQERVD